MYRSQIFEIVNLADELLPPLPQGTISLPMSYTVLVKGSSRKPPTASASKQDESSGTNEASAREKLLEEQPELLKQFGMDLLPILTQVPDFFTLVQGRWQNKDAKDKCLMNKLTITHNKRKEKQQLGCLHYNKNVHWLLASQQQECIHGNTLCECHGTLAFLTYYFFSFLLYRCMDPA